MPAHRDWKKNAIRTRTTVCNSNRVQCCASMSRRRSCKAPELSSFHHCVCVCVCVCVTPQACRLTEAAIHPACPSSRYKPANKPRRVPSLVYRARSLPSDSVLLPRSSMPTALARARRAVLSSDRVSGGCEHVLNLPQWHGLPRSRRPHDAWRRRAANTPSNLRLGVNLTLSGDFSDATPPPSR